MDDKGDWAWLVASLEVGVGAVLVVADATITGTLAVAMGRVSLLPSS